MKSVVFGLVVLLAIQIVPGAPASVGYCDGFLGLGTFEFGSNPEYRGVYYLDDRGYLFGNGIWFYQESNGIWTGAGPRADLQRGGSSPYWINDNEICVDDPTVPPDTLVY